MRRGFIARLLDVGLAFLIVLDVVLCFLWLAPLYLAGLASRPTGYQLISAYTGRAAINGHRWAIRLASAIDRLLGEGHCRRIAERLQGFAD